METEQKPTVPGDKEEAIGEARRRFLRQLASLPLYVAPLVISVSLVKGQPLFPSPPSPPLS